MDVHFDYGKEKNEKILNEPIQQKNFIDEWKQNLSKKLKVPVEDYYNNKYKRRLY